MIQKKNSVLIRKKRMRIEGNWKNHETTRYEKEAMFCYFCRKSKKMNPFASAEGCTNFCPPKNKNVPQNFSKGDTSPSDQIQILAQTLHLSYYFLSLPPALGFLLSPQDLGSLLMMLKQIFWLVISWSVHGTGGIILRIVGQIFLHANQFKFLFSWSHVINSRRSETKENE